MTKFTYAPGKNPDHAFAFKMMLSEQVAEAKVVDVIWTPSKDGYLKPRVQIEPIKLSGVTIEYATGKNAQFIEKNRIGVGAVIQIVRSGDVIPDIIKIVKPDKRAPHAKRRVCVESNACRYYVDKQRR